MANFDLFLPMLLGFEGGCVDDPEDPGGETNMGITMTTFQECSQRLLGLDPTLQNLRSLSDTQAGTIYKARYWDAVQGDSIALQDLANIVCDAYVNTGVNATKMLQRIMNGMGANIVEDGMIGPASVKALASLSQVDVYRQFKQGRILYYEELGQKYPKFLQGWLNRVNSFPDL
jgi:lysozyme family protein